MITNVETEPEIAFDTDHVPVIVNIKSKLKANIKNNWNKGRRSQSVYFQRIVGI